MTPSFEKLQKQLKQLPGLGHRSAERIALHLLLENRNLVDPLIKALQDAASNVHSCTVCGNLTEEAICSICLNEKRNKSVLCIVKSVPELYAIERTGSYAGSYHVLHGTLSPLKGIGPEKLNFKSLKDRIDSGQIEEIILALDNDLESEATCYYLQETFIKGLPIKVSRIGFGLPSGGGVEYADSATLKNALEGRRNFFSL